MRRGNYITRYLMVFGILAIIVIGWAVIYKHNVTKPVIDEYGYSHIKDQTTSTETSVSEVRKYETTYIVNVPQNMEDAFFKSINDGTSGYEFLSYALPYVNGGQEYTIFRFSDNTGLYIVKSNQTSAIYGEVEGNDIVQDIGYLNIAGMNLTYSPIPDYASRESRTLATYVPEEFHTDGLYVRVSETEAYICIATDEGAKKSADRVYEAVKDNLNGLPLIILVNDSYKYEYPEVNDDKLIEEMEEIND